MPCQWAVSRRDRAGGRAGGRDKQEERGGGGGTGQEGEQGGGIDKRREGGEGQTRGERGCVRWERRTEGVRVTLKSEEGGRRADMRGTN